MEGFMFARLLVGSFTGLAVSYKQPSQGPQWIQSVPVPMAEPEVALSAPELIGLLRQRWQASYDLRLVQRQSRLYFQVMWGHLEQQSFPMTPEAYAERIAEVAATLNEMGAAAQVREWLTRTRDRPRMGKALSLALATEGERIVEFLL